MLSHERFREQVLDYIYDLLAPAEAAEMDAYMSAHPEARLEVDRTRELLAAAARLEFPSVRFEAPSAAQEAAVQPAAPASRPRDTAPAAPRRSMRRVMIGWAVAICALLAIGGITYPTTRHFSGYLRAKDQLEAADRDLQIASVERGRLIENHQATIAAAAAKADEVSRQIQELQQQHDQKLQAAFEEIKNKHLALEVTGPPAIQPGAPNSFHVTTRRVTDGMTVPSRITFKLLDGKNHVVYEEKDVASQGIYNVNLPAALSIQSNALLTLEVSASSEGKIPSELKNVRIPWAAPRYVTEMSTDKPMYQPGQTVFFRSVTLNRGTLQPPVEDFQIEFSVTNPQGAVIYSARGETRLRRVGPGDTQPKPVLGPDGAPVRGIGAGEFKIPDDPKYPGGEYTLAVRELSNRFPEEKRKFLVNRYTADRINKELDFHRTTYGPGDEVIANCRIWNEAGPLANRRVVSASYIVDNVVYGAPLPGPTDSLGRVSVRFRLPATINKGAASLTVIFQDGAATEPIQKPIPIVVNKMFVKFFAEGGDLVAGLPNRVYFRATTPLDKPAELKGRILDSHGAAIAKIETFNDDKERGVNHGLGKFEFTPKANEKYVLKIDQPSGITNMIQLPDVKPDGVVLRVPTGVTGPGETIRAELYASGPARELLVGAYCRGRMLDHQRIETQPGKPATVELKPDDDTGGVVRVTVFEAQNHGPRQVYVPKAERLVFRKSAKSVKFSFTPDKSRYAPGEKATITIAATDEKGHPARVITGVSVVDETIITMADEKTARALPTHFMFVGEILKPEDLEFADFLLTDHPKAPIALDLLLGTQGWRRFLEQDPNRFRQRHPEDAERILVINGLSGERMVSSMAHRRQEIEAELQPKMKDLEERLKEAVTEKVVAEQDADFPKKLQERVAQIQQREKDYQSAAAAIAPYDQTNARIRGSAVPALAGAALLLALVSLVIGVVRGARAGVPYYVTAAGSVTVCALLLIGFAFSGSGATDRGMASRNPKHAKDGGVAFAPAARDNVMEQLEGAPPKAAPRFEMAKNAPADAMPLAPPAPAAEGPPADPQALAKKPAEAAPAPALGGGPQGAAGIAMGRDKAKGAPDQNGAIRNGNVRRFGRGNLAPMAPPGDIRQQFAGADPDAVKKVGRAELLLKEKDDVLRAKLNAEAEFQQRLADAKGGKDMGKRELKQQFPFGPMGGAPGQPRLGGAVAGGGIGGFGGGFGGFGGGGGRGGFPGGPPMGGFGPAGFGGGGFGGAGFMPPGLGMPAFEPFVVREFAHIHVATEPGKRTDFAETVYWNPALVLDASGKQKISFQVSDSITKYRLQVAGHTLEGRLGSGRQVIEVRKPFGLEAKLPAEVTAGDKLSIPLLITNDSDDQRAASVTVKPEGFELRSGSATDRIMLAPMQRSRRVVQLQPNIQDGQASLTIEGKGEPFGEDQVKRSISVVPEGFPVVGQASDLLERVAENEMTLPKGYVKGSLKVWANIYPSTLADLQKGLEGLLREPYGCFEQTSTTNYPNTLILNYIKESGQQTPEAAQAAKRAGELLDRGYQRLVSFECQKSAGGREGYEWFGGMAPPHEALTAYGLLQFSDMSKVHSVDQGMLERTRKYLFSRHKPEGGFQRNPRALDSFGGAPQHITDAYIIWALTETGKEDLTKDIDKLLKEHANSSDPYFLSLLANALLNSDGAERAKQAVKLLKRVRDKQSADGSLTGAETSITRSGGRDLQIETTALAMLAWMKANQPAEFTEPLQKAVKWINQQRGGYGGFGSTQSTILALKALIAYTKASKQTAEGGELKLSVNGQPAASVRFVAGRQEPVSIVVAEPEKFIKEGKNSLRLELSGKNKYPYTIGWSYSVLTPNSSDQCAVKLTTRLNKDQVREGEGVRLNVALENLSKDKGQPMTVAVIGLPAGLRVPEDMKQLKEMATIRKGDGDELIPGEISFFEIRGRELVLYWRALKPGAKIDLGIDLRADIPGEYRGPASRAYLYYTSDAKQWVEPLKVVIEPAE